MGKRGKVEATSVAGSCVLCTRMQHAQSEDVRMANVRTITRPAVFGKRHMNTGPICTHRNLYAIVSLL